jgi:hypothetical protein
MFQLKKMGPGSAAHHAARAARCAASGARPSFGLIVEVKSDSTHMSQITSPSDLAHGHRRAVRFDIDIAMRRGLHSGDQGLAGEVAFETTEFLSRDDDDFVASMDSHTLRSLAADTPHKFAETRLCVPKQPVAGVRVAVAAAGFCLFHRRFWISGHADQYITGARGISMKPTAKSCLSPTKWQRGRIGSAASWHVSLFSGVSAGSPTHHHPRRLFDRLDRRGEVGLRAHFANHHFP